MHGTLSGYFKHRCRCDECWLVANNYQRARRGAPLLTHRPVYDGPLWPERDFPGYGRLRCTICDRPYVEHGVSETCLTGGAR